VSVELTDGGSDMLGRLAHVHLDELMHLVPELCEALKPLLNHRFAPVTAGSGC
jgi:hypothetical protein